MGFSGWRRPARASLIAEASACDRLVLAEYHALEIVFQRAQRLGVVLGDGFGRNARHLGDDLFHFLDADHFLAA